MDEQEQSELAKEKERSKQMQGEFDLQRAKLRELYLQKEKEVNELKNQLMILKCKNENEIEHREKKAQEEISSLQQLVQETMDESSIIKQELERLQNENSRLKIENRELHEEIVSHQQDNSTLAPVLSHVKKTLAKKLGGDSGGSHDSLDESMRKVNKYAQEDAEVLRSLVVPLEEEIKALKEKLRATDEELQLQICKNTQKSGIELNQKENLDSPVLLTVNQDLIKFTKSNNSNLLLNASDVVCKSTSMDCFECEMCKDYEAKLQATQKSLNKKIEEYDKLQKLLNETREGLNKEAALRLDLETQWQEKREAHKEEVQYLTEEVKKNEKELLNIQQQFFETKEEIKKQLYRLTDERERLNKHLETLQSDNDYLSGKYLATAEEIESQNINLPNNVEELQELLLKQQSDLIQSLVKYEFEKRKTVEKTDESQILRDQLNALHAQRAEIDKKVQSRVRSLEDRVKAYLIDEQDYKNRTEKYERQCAEFNKNISELRVQVIELQDANEKLEKTNSDLKSKMKILQDDLSTSEQVQKDFVKLSQTLQIALEKFRQADTQVRWQDDDDVDKCPNCNVFFTVTCRKQHCRHCGTIYCEKCLTKTVPSGPSNKPAHVCDICHTLLSPNTAPYFSREPPQSPH